MFSKSPTGCALVMPVADSSGMAAGAGAMLPIAGRVIFRAGFLRAGDVAALRPVIFRPVILRLDDAFFVVLFRAADFFIFFLAPALRPLEDLPAADFFVDFLAMQPP